MGEVQPERGGLSSVTPRTPLSGKTEPCVWRTSASACLHHRTVSAALAGPRADVKAAWLLLAGSGLGGRDFSAVSTLHPTTTPGELSLLG